MLITLCVWTTVTVAQAQTNTVDTTKFARSFEGAKGDVLALATKTIAAVKEGKYAEALTQLAELAKQVNLTDEQKKSVKDLTAAVKNKLTGTAQQTGKEAEGAVNSLKKSFFGK